MQFEIKVLKPGDEDVLNKVGTDVFDNAVDQRTTKVFLADPWHHIVVAVEKGVVVGFVSAVNYLHPDKPVPVLWINEVGVASTHRGRGIGKALMASMFQVGRKYGCAEAWLLTDRTNPVAMRLYASVGGKHASQDQLLYRFGLNEG